MAIIYLPFQQAGAAVQVAAPEVELDDFCLRSVGYMVDIHCVAQFTLIIIGLPEYLGMNASGELLQTVDYSGTGTAG